MRVGFITGEYPPMRGGIADYSALLATHLRALGVEVFILTSRRAAPAVPPVYAHLGDWNRAVWGAIPAWVRAQGLHLVNLHYQTAAYDMAGSIHFLPQRLRGLAPVVTTFHDTRWPYLFPKAGFLRPWIVGHLARTSAGLIVTNPADERDLRARATPPLVRIPLGATVPAPPVLPALPAEAGCVAYFGLVNASKGLDTLLEALALLQGQGRPLRLLMIGEKVGASDPTNAAYTAHIEAKAAALGLTLEWTGYLDGAGLAQAFGRAQVVLLPFDEGASSRRTSLQAALAYGRPVITTTPPADDLPDLRDGQHLRYVPPRQPAALATTLAEVLDDPAQQARLGEGARAGARFYDWHSIAAQVLAFYQQVLGAAKMG